MRSSRMKAGRSDAQLLTLKKSVPQEDLFIFVGPHAAANIPRAKRHCRMREYEEVPDYKAAVARSTAKKGG